jgi:hypothetical protein
MWPNLPSIADSFMHVRFVSRNAIAPRTSRNGSYAAQPYLFECCLLSGAARQVVCECIRTPDQAEDASTLHVAKDELKTPAARRGTCCSRQHLISVQHDRRLAPAGVPCVHLVQERLPVKFLHDGKKRLICGRSLLVWCIIHLHSCNQQCPPPRTRRCTLLGCKLLTACTLRCPLGTRSC